MNEKWAKKIVKCVNNGKFTKFGRKKIYKRKYDTETDLAKKMYPKPWNKLICASVFLISVCYLSS